MLLKPTTKGFGVKGNANEASATETLVASSNLAGPSTTKISSD